MKLSPIEKCAMSYIKDRCDNVGVWVPNFELAEFVIGAKVAWNTLPDKVNGNITILKNGKWWLPDFCCFQYGDLNEETNNKAHLSYINVLKKHGLWKGHTRGIHAPQEKEKEKELDKDKEKEKKEYAQYVHMTPDEYEKLRHVYGKDATEQMIRKLDNYKGSVKGAAKKYVSDYRAILSWVVGELNLKPLVRAGPTRQLDAETERLTEELRKQRGT